jgi:hypothetical protein
MKKMTECGNMGDENKEAKKLIAINISDKARLPQKSI